MCFLIELLFQDFNVLFGVFEFGFGEEFRESMEALIKTLIKDLEVEIGCVQRSIWIALSAISEQELVIALMFWIVH